MKAFIILLPLVFFLTMPAQATDPMFEINQLLKNGKSEQALEKIDAFLSQQPKNAWGRNITQMRFLKGVLLAEQKRTAEAIQVFVKLTQDYPSLPEPYNNLAVLYAAQGRSEDARGALEQALRTDPTYATAYRNLNEIYIQLASQAYDHTLRASNGGKPAPALIKELCDNYGHMANQSVGRQQSGSGEISLIRDISKSHANAGAPPSKLDIDEMAVTTAPAEQAVPPTFTHPAAKPGAVAEAGSPRQGKTIPAPIAQPASPGETKTIVLTVQSWARAWSNKNIGAYLAFYDRDFRVPNGRSRAEWEKLRRERIGKPKSIKVSIEAPKVVLSDATHATVSFRQGYRSDSLQTSGHKTLLMVKNGGKWLILDEQAGS